MKKFLGEFREFALKGNVMDLAIGVIIGSAFTAITNSLVKDVVMPPIGFLLRGVDFTNLFIAISGREFATLAEAQAAGVVTINYGIFLNALINFLIIALIIFLVVKQINRLRRRDEAAEEIPNEKPCTFCTLKVPMAATRCPHCTSELHG